MGKQLAALFNVTGEVDLTRAEDAGEALKAVRNTGSPFDAMWLFTTMPYGDVGSELARDSFELDTGIELLRHVRKREAVPGPLLWVAVITARSSLAVARRVNELLAGCGKLYLKPFDTILV